MSDPNQPQQPAPSSLKGKLRLKQGNDFHMSSPTAPALQIPSFTPSNLPSLSQTTFTPANPIQGQTASVANNPTTDKPKPALKLKKNQDFDFVPPTSQGKTESGPTTTTPLQMNTKATSFTPQTPVLNSTIPSFQPMPQALPTFFPTPPIGMMQMPHMAPMGQMFMGFPNQGF